MAQHEIAPITRMNYAAKIRLYIVPKLVVIARFVRRRGAGGAVRRGAMR